MDYATYTYRLLADFQTALEVEGFSFDPGRHLQWARLLERIPNQYPPEKIVELICPLIAGNPKEQEQVYTIFKKCLRQARTLAPEFIADPSEDRSVVLANQTSKDEDFKNTLWSGVIIFVSLFLIGLVLMKFNQRWSAELDTAKISSSHSEINARSTQLIFPDSATAFQIGIVSKITFCNTSLDSIDSSFGRYRLAYNGGIKMTAWNKLGRDSICVNVKSQLGRTYLINYLIDVIPEDQTPKVFAQDNKEVSSFIPDELESPSDWGDFILIITLSVLVTIIAFVAFYRKSVSQKLYAIFDRNKPQYIWNIQLKNLSSVTLGDNFGMLLNFMRGRTDDNFNRIDIPATIRSTIENAGQVQIRYAIESRPLEYLLMIDRQSLNDHRANLFDEIYETLKLKGVIIRRFFYKSNVSICFNDTYPEGVLIENMPNLFPNANLLIVGSGYQFLNKSNGKLEKWADVFKLWEQRVLLSTRPVGYWGQREERLSEVFQVIPSSIQSMYALFEQTFLRKELKLSEIQAKGLDIFDKDIEFQDNLVSTLERHFPNPEIQQWIAACAIYPALNYNLSCYLGHLLSDKENHLVSFQNLSKINQLPWFIEGKIPDEARSILIDWFIQHYPDRYHLVREGLHTLLQKNRPLKNSFSYGNYRMQVATNELLLGGTPKRKKELASEINTLVRMGTPIDVVTLKYLHDPALGIDFEMPKDYQDIIAPASSTRQKTKSFGKDIILPLIGVSALLSAIALVIFTRGCFSSPQAFLMRLLIALGFSGTCYYLLGKFSLNFNSLAKAWGGLGIFILTYLMNPSAFFIVDCNEIIPVSVLVHGRRGISDTLFNQQGYVIMDSGNERIRQKISEKGEAAFGNLLFGTQVRFAIDFSEPYKTVNPDSIYTITKPGKIFLSVYLSDINKVFGKVIYKDQPLVGVIVSIDPALRDTTDELGNYEINIPVTLQKNEQTISFSRQGYKFLTKTAFLKTNEPLIVVMSK